MSRETTLAAFSNLNQEAGVALHKPLLALYALSQNLRHGTTTFRFAEIEEPLGALIRDARFGAAPSATARDPFWWMRNDLVWVVEDSHGAALEGDRPTIGELRQLDARGRFADGVEADLQACPGLAVELVGRLLCVYFNPADHQHLLERLGLWPV
jgi:hypothetical protein